MRKSLAIGLAALGIVAIAATTALFLRDLSRAHARIDGHSRTIATSFGTMEYARQGHGPPVLVVHGASGGFDQGLDMAGELSGEGFQLIAPSRFGYLRSSVPPNPTNAAQSDAYVELLDRLGIDKVDVVAISAGEWSALQFAIRHPERCHSLVLLVPAPVMPPQTSSVNGIFVRTIFGSDFVAWAIVKLLPVLPAIVTRSLLGSDPSVIQAADPVERARAQQVMDHLLPVSLRTEGMALDIKSATVPEPYALEKISCPVLTISAADDAFGTDRRAQFIAKTVPNGKAVIYPTGGHALVGDFKDVRRRIVAFLGGLSDKP